MLTFTRHLQRPAIAVVAVALLSASGTPGAGFVGSTVPAVLSPFVESSGYLGGAGNDVGNDVVVDKDGGVIVVGETHATNFPTGGRSTTLAGGTDAFVTKFTASGALVYSVYLGGTLDDRALGVATDTRGSAYVTGTTRSIDFPTTTGAVQTAYGGGALDAFVVKLDANGGVVYSTYLGGSDGEFGHSFERDLKVAVDSAGAAYVVGGTASANFPVTSGAYRTECEAPCWAGRPFLAKLDPTGSALVYATFLGGSYATDVAVDSDGNAYVVGRGAPVGATMVPSSASFGYMSETFVTKVNAAGSALVYSSRIAAAQLSGGIAVDAAGSAYVVGNVICGGTNYFLTTPGAFQAAGPCWAWNSYVAKLSPAGDAFVYASEIGGSSVDLARDVFVDSSGRAYVTGSTSSADFPLVNPVRSALSGWGGDAFLMRVGPLGNELELASYIGGSSSEDGYAIAAGPDGAIVVVGSTTSTDFPVVRAFQASNGGGLCPNPYNPWISDPCTDAFVTKVGFPRNVQIDVLPDSDINPIYTSQAGNLPLAILGSLVLDAAEIDPVSVRLGTVAVASRGGPHDRLAYSLEDVNDDGVADLVVFFDVPALVEAGVVSATTTSLTLTAQLFDGQRIWGTDVVEVVH